MEEVDPAAAHPRLVVALDAEPLAHVHAPEPLLQPGEDLVVVHRRIVPHPAQPTKPNDAGCSV
jgi:hypothetical protein